MITPAQIRAARMLINMSQAELAELVDLSIVTIKRAESERTIAPLLAAFDTAGNSLLVSHAAF